MPEAIIDQPVPACYPPVPGNGIEQSQSLDPDLPRARARDARGRFAKGHSGNPRGRPPGIPNPKRRLLDFATRPPREGALAALLDRKPYLVRRFAQQLLPPLRIAIDPAERLGLDLSSVRTVEDCWQMLRTVWTAISRGDLAPAEALRITRRARTRFRAARRRERVLRRLTRAASARIVASAPAKVQKPRWETG